MTEHHSQLAALLCNFTHSFGVAVILPANHYTKILLSWLTVTTHKNRTGTLPQVVQGRQQKD
jgi:hypothetical protein